MVKKFTASINNIIFSKRTNYLLNNFTLQINDREISDSYEKIRLERLESLIWPTFFLTVLDSILSLILEFGLKNEGNLAGRIWYIPHISFLLSYFFGKKIKKSFTQVVVFVPHFLAFIFYNLRLRSFISE